MKEWKYYFSFPLNNISTLEASRMVHTTVICEVPKGKKDGHDKVICPLSICLFVYLFIVYLVSMHQLLVAYFMHVNLVAQSMNFMNFTCTPDLGFEVGVL